MCFNEFVYTKMFIKKMNSTDVFWMLNIVYSLLQKPRPHSAAHL